MKCIKCNNDLNNDNWAMASQKYCHYICKKCAVIQARINYNKKPWVYRLNAIRGNARYRKKAWDIPNDIGYCLISSPCAYCGGIPEEFNGLDRINSKKGYTVENVVPCCQRCNRAKNDMSIDKFINHINDIHHYLIEK